MPEKRPNRSCSQTPQPRQRSRPQGKSPYSGYRRRARSRRRRRVVWRRLLPVIILLALFLYGAVSLARYCVRSVQTKRTNAELAQVYEAVQETPAPVQKSTYAPLQTAEPEQQVQLLDTYQYLGNEMLPEMVEMFRKNKDMVAWVHIPEVVNLPVAYRDNSYYLDHDFYGKKNDGGTLFLDKDHCFDGDTQYLVVHGHAMYDGSMFGLLTHYRKQGYMEAHPTVYFDTLYRREEYEVVCVLSVPTDVKKDGYVPYMGTRKFETLDQFNDFVKKLRANAMHWAEGKELLPTDALLSLSTCYDDERVVVMCRRVKP